MMSVTGLNGDMSSLNAYTNALAEFRKSQSTIKQDSAGIMGASNAPAQSFTETLQNSLKSVNDLQSEKNTMVESFASGETQNVHELMITMQKAGLAVNLTAAVRNKVLEAYRELTRLQF